MRRNSCEQHHDLTHRYYNVNCILACVLLRTARLGTRSAVVSWNMLRLRMESTPPPAAERQHFLGGCADVMSGAFCCVPPICLPGQNKRKTLPGAEASHATASNAAFGRDAPSDKFLLITRPCDAVPCDRLFSSHCRAMTAPKEHCFATPVTDIDSSSHFCYISQICRLQVHAHMCRMRPASAFRWQQGDMRRGGIRNCSPQRHALE
jgi:hypothetical protein